MWAGQHLRFLPNEKFAVGLVLQNTSRTPVVARDAEVVEPPLTPIRQIGTRFHGFEQTACSGAGCPASTFPIGVGKAAQAHPFTIRPGELVGVELDFRLGSCADVADSSPAPISSAAGRSSTPRRSSR